MAKKAMKRPNGAGTVIDYGPRARLRYGGRITVGIIDGKQIYKYLDRFETKTEARRQLDLYAAGQYVPPSNMTLAELFSEWSSLHYPRISKQLRDNYNAAFKHLAPLHKKKFVELRTVNFQSLIDALSLSYSSKSKIKALAGMLYKYAMMNDIVNKNYASFVNIGKQEKTEKTVFTAEEIEKLKAVRPESDMILILIYTGFRLQELLNLTADDIDLEEGVIHGGLKTDAGRNRIVPLHPYIQHIVSSLCENKRGPLFVNPSGSVITQDYFRKRIYYPLLDKLGIPRRTPHSTRHTFATLLVEGGADPKAVTDLLGHTDYAFTANTYAHSDFNFLKNAVMLL